VHVDVDPFACEQDTARRERTVVAPSGAVVEAVIDGNGGVELQAT